MDLQEDFLNMQIAYEKNCAVRCNCSYEELKAQLDKSESLFGTRYLEGSPRHENWLLWVQAWQAAKAQAVPAEFEIGRLKDQITELLDERQDLYAQINAQAVPEKVLDTPACVGGGTFQKGVKWSTVIAAAQRHFKYTQNAKKATSLDIDQVKKLVSGDFVLVPAKNVKYFSNDGENYEIHGTLAEAKHEAECAIEHFSERLADQLCDPREDGNFQDVGYGVILGHSAYSLDHVVIQEDIDNGDYSYDVGTEIMSLFLVEAQEQKG